jgi:hypothetical protein
MPQICWFRTNLGCRMEALKKFQDFAGLGRMDDEEEVFFFFYECPC